MVFKLALFRLAKRNILGALAHIHTADAVRNLRDFFAGIKECLHISLQILAKFPGGWSGLTGFRCHNIYLLVV
jgi:hypothetical protein